MGRSWKWGSTRTVARARARALQRRQAQRIKAATAERARLERLYRFNRASDSAIQAARLRVGRLNPTTVAATEPALFEAWKHGHLRPYRLTIAFNQAGFEGPWVDEALHVAEPMVNRWEQGHIYPTWTNLVHISELTGTPLTDLLIDHDDDYQPKFTRCSSTFGQERLRKHYAKPIVEAVVNAHPNTPTPDELDHAYQLGRVDVLQPIINAIREHFPDQTDLEIANSIR